MDNKDLVSIIIPAKNRFDLLKRTLSNILNQSHEQIEVIIVNDHSEESTIELELLKKRDQRVKLLQNINRGPGAARNYGLKYAKGEYIKFFDSDDLMTASLIENQVKCLKESGADLVYSPYVRVTEKGGKFVQMDEILHYHPWKESISLKNLMLRGFFIAIPALLFKKEFAYSIESWNEENITYEDWKYLWSIANGFPKVAHINTDVFFYIIHGQQSTGSLLSDKERSVEKDAILIPVLLKQYNYPEISWYDKWILGALLHREIKGLSEPSLKIKYSKYLRSNSLSLYNILWRGYNRILRIVKKSSWSSYYGALNSNNKFEEYANNIIYDKEFS